jgi:1-acyl-sn-glycerol-3-phosphate acyltransferase
MTGKISQLILNLFGWHTNGSLPPGIRKAVMIVAPHTSTWDFVIGRLTFYGTGPRLRVLIKKEAFFFPLNILLKALGGIPVNRGKKNNMVVNVASYFEQYESMVVVITPEGTRRISRHWKKGFYLIAQEAKVPIALAFIDYKNKTGGVGPLIDPSGDYEKDMAIIYNFYRDKTARHPERFFLPAEPEKKQRNETPLQTVDDNNENTV